MELLLTAVVTKKSATESEHAAAIQSQPTACIEIVRDYGLIYLLRKNASGEQTADTWHPSVEEAKDQALFEFGVGADEWSVVADSTV
jgi:hypothetical protein